MANGLPTAFMAWIMRSASASEEAKGFSMRMGTPNGATFSVHSAWSAVAGHNSARSGLVLSMHWR
jgi:hypothetical protein